MIVDIILGLDVSTSIVGWTALAVDAPPGSRPLEGMWGHIDLRKVEGFWAKSDRAQSEVRSVVSTLGTMGHRITEVAIECPVKKFTRGKSTAGTIVLLARFNALVSHFSREVTGLDPSYIDVTVARKSLGVKLLSRKKSGGKGQKEQTFEFLGETVFKDEAWDLNRNGNIQPWCYDRVDSYVIAMAAVLGQGEEA